MSNPTIYREVPTSMQPVRTYNKGDCVTIAGSTHIIMAKLSADKSSPISYNICTEDLRAPQFGVSLDTAEFIPSIALTEEIKNRAKNFL